MAKKTHRWAFKSRFRANAYGWRGSTLASKRLREAVAEIKKVKRSDPVLAAQGAIALIERLWPSLEAIDTSSGALGNAVYRTLKEIIPIIVAAPVGQNTRSTWCDRLFEAIEEDGVDYLSPAADQWGSICHFEELANQWADRLLPLLRSAWSGSASGWVKGGTICLSCLVRTERYDELRGLLNLKTYRFWCLDQYWANALVQQGDVDGALAFAESQLENLQSNDARSIEEYCERLLLSAGRSDEAYRKYGLSASLSGTNLATYRSILKKYPDHEPHQILLDLIERSGQKGKWFAAAKTAGLLDLATECAADIAAEPSTLIRAARDFTDKEPSFSAQVAFCALEHLLAGRGYEPSTADVSQAYGHLQTAAASAGVTDQMVEMTTALLDRYEDSSRNVMWQTLHAAHQRTLRGNQDENHSKL